MHVIDYSFAYDELNTIFNIFSIYKNDFINGSKKYGGIFIGLEKKQLIIQYNSFDFLAISITNSEFKYYLLKEIKKHIKQAYNIRVYKNENYWMEIMSFNPAQLNHYLKNLTVTPEDPMNAITITCEAS